MQEELENKEIEKLIRIINHISLNEENLLEASLEFATLFFKYNINAKLKFEELFDNQKFSEKVCLVAREGVVLGMQAITLKEEIPFVKVIKACLDIHQLSSNQSDITNDEKEQKIINKFFLYLRKELFISIYKQNRDLQKNCGISNKVLKERQEILFNYPFNELL